MRTVTVTGRGESRVAPDAAVLRVSVGAREQGLAAAYDRAGELAARVREVALRHTEERRIASTGVSLWPFHDHPDGERGFEARYSYAVSCGDLDAAGTLLRELAHEVGDGVQVDDVSLQVSDDSAAVVTAREAAFADARSRAEHLAGLSGATLGAVEQIGEGGYAAPAPRGAVFAMRADAQVAPGETTVGVDLTVTWQLLGGEA
ncbi:MAG: SIMPL domain-containing protein [Nocardioides sp.]|uniref:SIMPL domain-containing protein n=1 Tax=Nocardioides sp. TaxID=35761 RepID=UPI003F0B8D2D